MQRLFSSFSGYEAEIRPVGKIADDVISAVAEFIDPWLGDKVNSGIGL